MDNIFELLLKKYKALLWDLKLGYTIDNKKLDDIWMLLHILHFISYDSNSGDLVNTLIEYYG